LCFCEIFEKLGKNKERVMTLEEIKRELEKIYEEFKEWEGGKGPFTEREIRRRELILMKQQVLYLMEDAKLLRDESKEAFANDLYNVIKGYLEELQRDV
jgi:cytochrome c biogenesis factor